MADPTNMDRFAEFYGVVCDVVERAWHHQPANPGPDDLSFTSPYARQAANRVVEALGEIRDIDTRADADIQDAEEEMFDRLWYYRALSGERSADDLAAAAENLARVEASYPDAKAELTDYERGVIEGKLSALRWVLGDEWDNLDT